MATVDLRAAVKPGERASTEYMNFGKHEGEHIESVPGHYLLWVAENVAHKLRPRRLNFILSTAAYREALEERKIKEAEKEKRREEIKAERAKSEWLGEIGERREFEIKVVFIKDYDSYFGPGRLVIAIDAEGNAVKSMGTAEALWMMNRGGEYLIKGTVSDHETYEGAKSTMIKRVAMINELEAA